MVYERWSNTQRRSRLKQLEEGYKSCTYLIESHRDSALKWLNDNNYGRSLHSLIHECQERRL